MTGASLLIGAALAVATAAYLARPFRAARREDPGRSIERWVTAARVPQGLESAPAVASAAEARFCRECGRALTPDSRFCAGCGTPVEGQR
ncbi:MAG: zinc ribbon domain-containing protein [Anaerolineae bacterium]|mgnify:CR=1 FL=1|nr:zinc ribbon domain-containing protein [Anaerolineae bacterium]